MIVALVLAQTVLICIGVWQVQSANPLIMCAGVFNIIVNLIFGAMNVRTLFKG